MEINRASRATPGPSRDKGFTLIELMIVVIVIAILTAVAYPAYRNHAMRANRAEAKAMLVDAAARLERFYSNSNPATYTADMRDLNYAADPADSETGLYEVDVVTPAPAGCPILTCFRLQATAQAGQLDDTECAILTFSSIGVRAAEDDGGNDTTTTCW